VRTTEELDSAFELLGSWHLENSNATMLWKVEWASLS